MKRTLIISCIVVTVTTILIWRVFLAPPSSFYAVDKLKITKNNSFLVYHPGYSIRHSGQRQGTSWGDTYAFRFWSGYGIRSLRVYSNSGQVLYDKELAYKEQDEMLIRMESSRESVVYVYYPRDWLERDAIFSLEISPGNSPEVEMTDYLGNQFEGTIKLSAAR